MIDLYLIRHAECENNINNHLISGRSNHSPLTKNGIKQAMLLGMRLKRENIKFDEVYSSPAIRTMETAKLSLGNIDDIIISDNLQELDQGDWVGRLREEVYSKETIKEIDKDCWNFRPPNGETQAEVQKRVYDVIKKNVINNNDKITAFYTHGVAIKCLLKDVMNLDHRITWRIQIDNTSITQLRYDNGLWWPIKINDNGHVY